MSAVETIVILVVCDVSVADMKVSLFISLLVLYASVSTYLYQYTPWPIKRATSLRLFKTKVPCFLVDFYNFYTTGNRNKQYSTNKLQNA